MAGNIRDVLTELDPAHGPEYASNYERFAAGLEELDRDIRSILDDPPNRKFLVFHPAWGYFAQTYGLIQVAIEKEGKEPGARGLGTLIEQARRERVGVIFVQPQFSKRSASRVARAIGGRVATIDPLAPDYADNLRRVARQIAGEVPE
jgi:zinc transport system substrate-binding protein